MSFLLSFDDLSITLLPYGVKTFLKFFNWLVFLHAPERGAGVLVTPIALGLNLCHRAVPPVPALVREVSFCCLLSFDDLMISLFSGGVNTFFKFFYFVWESRGLPPFPTPKHRNPTRGRGVRIPLREGNARKRGPQ